MNGYFHNYVIALHSSFSMLFIIMCLVKELKVEDNKVPFIFFFFFAAISLSKVSKLSFVLVPQHLSIFCLLLHSHILLHMHVWYVNEHFGSSKSFYNSLFVCICGHPPPHVCVYISEHLKVWTLLAVNT